MKTLYIILVLGMLSLIPNTTLAQIVQYSDDGKSACIDCEEKRLESPRSCFCESRSQLLLFDFYRNSIPGDYRRQQWLYEQELLLASAMTNIPYYDMHNGPLGLPGDYNFNEIQQKYLKGTFRNEIHSVYSDMLLYFQKNTNYSEDKLEEFTIAEKIMSIRLDAGTAEGRVYGDLKYKGRPIHEIDDAEAFLLRVANEQARNTQREFYKEFSIKKQQLDYALEKTDQIESHLTHEYIKHYNWLDYEPAIEFMTTVMVWGNTSDNLVFSNTSAANPGIFEVVHRDHGLGIELEIRDNPYRPMEAGDVDLFDVLNNLALKEYSLQIRSFLDKDTKLKGAVLEYLQKNRYTRASLDMMGNLIRSHLSSDGIFVQNDSHFASYGNPVIFQTEGDANQALAWNAVSENPNGLPYWGIGNVMQQLYAIDPDASLTKEKEAYHIRQMFRANEVEIPATFTANDLSALFDFRRTPVQIKYPSQFGNRVTIEFTNNIGQTLWNNGIRFHEMVDRPYVLEGVRALLNNQSFDFAHRTRVWELTKDLSLNDEQKNWLISRVEETKAIQSHLIINNNSIRSQTEAILTIGSGATTSPWVSASGTIAGNENFRYDATRTWTYPDGQQVTEFRLTNGDRIARGNYAIAPYSSESNDVTWYRPIGSQDWFHVVIDLPTSTSADPFNFIIDEFWDGAKFTGRYIVPVEDIGILLGGRDFDGNYANQYLAGGMLLVSAIPGGKIVKPVARVAKKTLAWKLVLGAGDEALTLSYKIVNGVVDFGSRSKLAKIIATKVGEEAHHMIPWALLNDNVVQEAAYAGFHMNNKINGRALKKFSSLTPDGVHANHPQYNIYVNKRLQDFKDLGPFEPEDAKKFLEEVLIPELNGLINNAINSKSTLNEFFRLLN